MAGFCKQYVIFPFYFDGARNARIQIEPFASIRCYGLLVKIILELTLGTGANKYYVERIVYEEALIQENIQDGFMAQPFMETMEAFYYNKTDKEVLVPVCAMILKGYFSDVLNAFQISLDEYVIDIEYKTEEIGFKQRGVSHVSHQTTNKSIYKTEKVAETEMFENNNQEENRISCKDIVQLLKEKNKTRKTR
jgi:hypothetical protein